MEKLTALQKVTLCTVTVATHTHTIIFLLAIKQWGTSSNGGTITFPLSASTTYSVLTAKKDTSANSIPDARSYTNTGFTYYGPTPFAWFATCKA